MLDNIVDQRSGADRRMKQLSFRIPDRRLGYVRRQTRGGRARAFYNRALAAYRSAPQSLAVVLVAIVMLNLADLMLTLRAIEVGAVELNPVMAALIEADPLLASLFKATVVIGVVAVMWAMRRYRRVLEASILLLAGFVLLTAYSASMLIFVG